MVYPWVSDDDSDHVDVISAFQIWKSWVKLGLLLWPSVCLSIHLSVLTLFPFENVSIYFKQISFKCCICIHTKHVMLGIDSSISIIYHSVMALVIVQNSFLVSIILDYHDVKFHKMIELTKALY